jgi:hypothetical protein
MKSLSALGILILLLVTSSGGLTQETRITVVGAKRP